jgi:hypothetical protein
MSKPEQTLYQLFSHPKGSAFKVGDTVHILEEPITSPASGSSKPASSNVDEYVRKTIWRITSIDAADQSSGHKHIYHLQPQNIVHVIMPESRLVAINWLPDSIVKDNNGFCYKVEEVKFQRLGNGSISRRYVVRNELGAQSVVGEEGLKSADAREWFPVQN